MNEDLAEKAAGRIDLLARRLIDSMHADGYWEGRLSSSALSTATALSALSLANCDKDRPRIRSGVDWLTAHAHAEGGWGDTADSPANLATTLLVLAALKLAKDSSLASTNACEYLESKGLILGATAGLSSSAVQYSILEAVGREYGEDRTFAVPILMNCALAGFVAWSDIPGLPFELAVFPPTFYKILRLHVVSYAMPALIAIGLLLDRRNPPKNPLKRLIRKISVTKVLKILQSMQPSGGGFLEAVPLTSFAAMGLVSTFGKEQPVAAECLKFLRHSQRDDGSWPIDSNLSTWLTTSAVAALAEARQLEKIDRRRVARWIAERQGTTRHPFTHAASGGWPWTHLPGGVPDADDTSGAILALADLNSSLGDAASNSKRLADGAKWLLDLQNSDGGWPTFCRGWGKLPFDRSSPDITAHVLRALHKIESWKRKRIDSAIRRGLDYLARTQQPDGSWIPLWFGNQAAPGRENPAIGTSLVLRALEEFDSEKDRSLRGVEYLLRVHNSDGGWGGAAAVPSTLEETALAISALAPWEKSLNVGTAIQSGVEYLLREMETSFEQPSPVGLYFSHLWYAEKLYPQIWTLEALGRAIYLS